MFIWFLDICLVSYFFSLKQLTLLPAFSDKTNPLIIIIKQLKWIKNYLELLCFLLSCLRCKINAHILGCRAGALLKHNYNLDIENNCIN